MDILVILGSLSLHRMLFGTESLGITLTLFVNVPCVVYGYFSHQGTQDTDITSIAMPLDTEVAFITSNKLGDHPSGIPVNYFNSFTHLRQLYLTHNNLDENDLPGGVFSGIGGTLMTLSLSINSLTVIRSNLLTGLSSLKILDVNSNQIATIELGKKLE